MQSYQTSRHELKYLITEAQADAIRTETLAYLVPDAYSKGNGYQVNSLYLDSRDFACCNDTRCGTKNRFKLRMRFYDDSPTSPVFLEVKRRVTNIVQKERAAVTHQAALELLRGYRPSASMLKIDNASHRQGLETFCRLRDQLCGVGKVFVSYQREAYQSKDSSRYRVTFDRNVRGCLYTPGTRLLIPEKSRMTKIDDVVLEMKFTNEPAPWMVRIAQRYNLQPTSVPKYVECVDVTVGLTHLFTTSTSSTMHSG